ncbi:MAG TPA: hypothetical protein VHF05_02340 [Candidatus Paceibacterota bacterium]|jgi:hypothetical protein|nr:hypothetical protein [Candidatus Paceibacterota bacterium]
MTRRLKKIIVPFVILPLVTGGLLTFVVIVDQSDDADAVLTNTLPAFPDIIARNAPSSLISISVAAIIVVSAALVFAFFFLFFLIENALVLSDPARSFVRNRSPPRLKAA